MRKSILAVLVAAVCAVAATAAGAAVLKKEYKLSCNLTENTVWGQGASMFCKLVAERTNGKVNIKPYYSAQLLSGKQSNELLMIRNGSIDFSYAGIGNWSATLPGTSLFSLPWFIASSGDSDKALDAIINGKAGAMLRDMIAEKGISIFGYGHTSPRHFHGNRPLTKPEDFKNLNFRFVSQPLTKDIFGEMGANGININWSEAITAFQQGLCDAGENPYNVIIPYRVYEFHKYVTDCSYTIPIYFFVANTRVWNSFDDETRGVLVECAKEAGLYARMLGNLGLDDGSAYKWLEERKLLPAEDDMVIPRDPLKLLADNGVTVHKSTPEEIMAFRKATRGAFYKHIKIIGEKLVEAAEDDMRAAGLRVERP